MSITRCSDQKHEPLEEFYTELSKSERSSEAGKTMLAILNLLNESFNQIEMFGLTSHYHLILLSQNSFKSDWYVSIAALDGRNIFIEYLIPENKSPWPYAKVKGEARSLEEAISFIIIAMTESEGWKSSEALKTLYKNVNW